MKFLLKILKQNARNNILKLIPKDSVCCEIGVWKGEFSQEIINKVKPKELHLIDPWKFYPEYKNRWYGGTKTQSQGDMNIIYKKVKEKFKGMKSVVIKRNTSDAMARKFEDDYFDFIYIDGNHSYEFVIKDLENYYPKLKKGGIIAGDDYSWKEGMKFPIRKAVKNFAKENNLSYFLILDNFIFKKPS